MLKPVFHFDGVDRVGPLYPAYYSISSSVEAPLTIEYLGDGIFTFHQSSALNFNFSSPEGNLTGTINLDNVTSEEIAQNGVVTATAYGTFIPTGGSFMTAFATTGSGNVKMTFSLGGTLESVVGTSNTITGQVEYPTTITPTTSGQCDFLTGGGWIPNTSATGPGSSPGGGNGKATFAIEGGCKHCHGWGHLNYIDHGTGMHVTGDPDPSCPVAYGVVSNGPTGSNGQPTGCRRMRGKAKINGQGGYNYDVTACDNGEPGTSDTFSITLSNGYSNSGTLGGGVQGGGNIQLHKGNQSFCCTNP